MAGPLKLSKADARRALIRHHFTPAASMAEAFDRLRSVQFDPIAPVGCNHDLVLQARVPGYRVGDWEAFAYGERRVYDGWDKQACLVPFEGWPVRRIFHKWHRPRFARVLDEHAEAVAAVRREIEARGPLLPRECEFQEHRAEWKGSWFGPSLTKQALRALWHTGEVMTAGRRRGQHLYDLTERIVPADLLAQPMPSEAEAVRELVRERHRAMGLLRPGASYEVWSFHVPASVRRDAIRGLVEAEEVVPVDVEGMAAHATPAFLAGLDRPAPEPQIGFVAPLDQFMWDRKMIAHLFGFEYVWEIYTPEPKRRWGYYVLPVRFDDALVARAEFWCRKGVLELRRWHFEAGNPGPEFLPELERALRRFMGYCGAEEIRAEGDLDPTIRDLAAGMV